MPRTPSRDHREPLRRTSLRLPEDLWKRARLAAVTHDLTLQDLVEDALLAHLAQLEGTEIPRTRKGDPH